MTLIRIALHLVQVLASVHPASFSASFTLPFADISLETCQVILHNVAMIIL